MLLKTKRSGKCPLCLQAVDIIGEENLLTVVIARLSCGHTCVMSQVERASTEGEDKMTGGKEQKCVACKESFVTWATGALAEFCQECRELLNLTTQREAAQEKADILAKGGTNPTMALVGRVRSVTPSQAVASAAPPLDPKIKLAITRSMVEYGRLADDDRPLTQQTTYVIAKDGLMEVRHTDVAAIVTKAKTVIGVDAGLNEGVQLNVPPVPYDILAKTVAFFRAVCVKANHASEAYLQIWWNTQEKAYHVHVPKQNVSGASVNHQGQFDEHCERTEAGQQVWIHVMDIHSHGSMDAFWSGTDNNDEMKAPEGRLFGVIGKVAQPTPVWRWRIRTREGFQDLEITSIFDFKSQPNIEFDVSWPVLMTALKKGGVNGMVELLCPVDPFKGEECPKEWVDQVTTSGGGVHHMHGGSGWQRQQDPKTVIYIQTGNRVEEFEKLPNGSLNKTGFALTLREEAGK